MLSHVTVCVHVTLCEGLELSLETNEESIVLTLQSGVSCSCRKLSVMCLQIKHATRCVMYHVVVCHMSRSVLMCHWPLSHTTDC